MVTEQERNLLFAIRFPQRAEPELSYSATESSGHPARRGAAASESDVLVATASRQLLLGANELLASSQRLFRLRAVLMWAAFTLSVLVVLVFLDALLRREEMGLRILMLAALVAATVSAAYFWLLPAWRFAPSLRDLARWLQRTQPADGERLATAIQLASVGEDENRYGSRNFRDATIEQWSQIGPHPDWKKLADRQPIRQMMVVFGIIAAVAFGSILKWPRESKIGLTRIAVPWASASWPRQDQLELVNLPNAIAMGDELQLEIVDRNPPLPELIDVLVRSAGSSERNGVTAIPATALGEIAVANLPVFDSSIEVGVVGGDDQTPDWHRIGVVKPPQLEEYQFQIRPPAYTRQKPLEAVAERIQVLERTEVQFTGRLSSPVRSLSLDWLDNSRSRQLETSTRDANNPQPGANGTFSAETTPDASMQMTSAPVKSLWVARLDDDGQSFVVGTPGKSKSGIGKSGTQQDWNSASNELSSWIANRSIRWQFAIETEDGVSVTLPQVWAVEVKPDDPPVVMLDQSSLPEASTQADLAIRVRATDDLGLTSIAARAVISRAVDAQAPASSDSDIENSESPSAGSISGRESPANSGLEASDQGVPKTILLWELDTSNVSAEEIEAPLQLELDRIWDLLSRENVSVGQTIELWVEAVDTLGQTGRSNERKIAIRSVDAVLDSIQERERKILERLRSVVDAQRRNLQVSDREAEIVNQSDRVDQNSIDSLSSIAQVQTSIREQISLSDASITTDIDEVLKLLKQNRLSDAPQAMALASLGEQLMSISEGEVRESLETALAAADEARQLKETDSTASATIKESLKTLSSTQVTALQRLQSVVDQLARNEALQQIQSELAQLLSSQDQLMRSTDALALEEVSQTESTVTNIRAGLTADQQGLARRLDGVVERMRKQVVDPGASGESRVQKIEQALTTLVKRRATELMRGSSQSISQSELASAIASQREVIDVLRDALREIDVAGGAAASLADRADQLRELSQTLSELASQQSSLAAELGEQPTPERLDELGQQQASLREQAETGKVELDATGDSATSRSVGAAIEEQNAASNAIEENDARAAADAAKQAAERLGEAADSADQRSNRLEQEAQQQEIFQLAGSLKLLADSQQTVVDRLQGISDLADEVSHNYSDETKSAIRGIAAEQESVQQELRQVRFETGSLPAFDWALEQTDVDMSRSVAAAKRFRVNPEALQSAIAALLKLRLASESMAQPESEPSSSDAEAADQSGDPERRQRLAPPIASLKLLRGLQKDINARTVELDSAEDQTVNKSQELAELASQQQALGQQLEALLREIEAMQRAKE